MLGRAKVTGSPSHFRAVFSQGERYYEIQSFADGIPWKRLNCRRLQTLCNRHVSCRLFDLFSDTSFNSQHLNISPFVNIPFSPAEVKFLLPSIRMEQGTGKVNFTLE
jgi:hypothetical protein